MFGIFKRKDKEQSSAGQSEVWGQPATPRKLSKDEAAREAAEQKLVEQRNQERRDMYRMAGRERIFTDQQGHRLALRTEDNTGPTASPHHPPVQVLAFWGVREIGYVRAEVGSDNTLHQLDAHVETAFAGRGIAAELLSEMEAVAREKGLRQVVCSGRDGDEWSAAFLTQAGYGPQGTNLVKTLS